MRNRAKALISFSFCSITGSFCVDSQKEGRRRRLSTASIAVSTGAPGRRARQFCPPSSRSLASCNLFESSFFVHTCSTRAILTIQHCIEMCVTQISSVKQQWGSVKQQWREWKRTNVKALLGTVDSACAACTCCNTLLLAQAWAASGASIPAAAAGVMMHGAGSQTGSTRSKDKVTSSVVYSSPAWSTYIAF